MLTIIEKQTRTHRRLIACRREVRSTEGVQHNPNVKAGESVSFEIEVPKTHTLEAFILGSHGDCSYGIEAGDASVAVDLDAGISLEWFQGCGFQHPLQPGKNTITIVNNGSKTTSVVVVAAYTKIKE